MKKSLTVQSIVLSSVLLSLSSGAFAQDPISAVGKAIEKGAVEVTEGAAKVVGEGVKGTEKVANELGDAATSGYKSGHQ